MCELLFGHENQKKKCGYCKYQLRLWEFKVLYPENQKKKSINSFQKRGGVWVDLLGFRTLDTVIKGEKEE